MSISVKNGEINECSIVNLLPISSLTLIVSRTLIIKQHKQTDSPENVHCLSYLPSKHVKTPNTDRLFLTDTAHYMINDAPRSSPACKSMFLFCDHTITWTYRFGEGGCH